MEDFEKIAKIEELFEGFNDRERIFVETYCRYLSKTRAAEAAKYSPKNIGVSGFNAYHRPKINEAIKKYLAIIAITPEENIRLMTRIAKTNLSDYFTPVNTYQTVRAKIPILKIIEELRMKIDIEDAVLLEDDLLSKLEKTKILASIKTMSIELIRLEAEASINPKAYRLQYVDKLVAEKILNVEKLVEDRVALKSVKYTKDGIQVETYPADAAQERLAKINGSFEEDNKQLRPVINNSVGLTADKLARLTEDELRIMSQIENKLNA